MNGQGMWITIGAIVVGLVLLAIGASITEFMMPTDPTLLSTGLSLIALGLTFFFVGVGLGVAILGSPREM